MYRHVEAKDLINSFLTVDASKRMTAGDALNHPWFNMEKLSGESLKETQEELKKNYRRVFKSAVNAIKSINRVSTLVGRPLREASMNIGASLSDEFKVELPSDVVDSLSEQDKEAMEKSASTYTTFGG